MHMVSIETTQTKIDHGYRCVSENRRSDDNSNQLYSYVHNYSIDLLFVGLTLFSLSLFPIIVSYNRISSFFARFTVAIKLNA